MRKITWETCNIQTTNYKLQICARAEEDSLRASVIEILAEICADATGGARR
jgi:hypothetical protein